MTDHVYADYTRSLYGQQSVLSCMDCDYVTDDRDSAAAIGNHLSSDPTHELMLFAQETTVGMIRTGTALPTASGQPGGKMILPNRTITIDDTGHTYLIWDMGFGGWRTRIPGKYSHVVQDAARWTTSEVISETLATAQTGKLHKSIAVIISPEDYAKMSGDGRGKSGNRGGLVTVHPDSSGSYQAGAARGIDNLRNVHDGGGTQSGRNAESNAGTWPDAKAGRISGTVECDVRSAGTRKIDTREGAVTARIPDANADQVPYIYCCDGPACDESTAGNHTHGWLYVNRWHTFAASGRECVQFCGTICMARWGILANVAETRSREVAVWTPMHQNLRLWWLSSSPDGGGPFTDPLGLALSPVDVTITSRGGGSCPRTSTG